MTAIKTAPLSQTTLTLIKRLCIAHPLLHHFKYGSQDQISGINYTPIYPMNPAVSAITHLSVIKF